MSEFYLHGVIPLCCKVLISFKLDLEKVQLGISRARSKASAQRLHFLAEWSPTVHQASCNPSVRCVWAMGAMQWSRPSATREPGAQEGGRGNSVFLEASVAQIWCHCRGHIYYGYWLLPGVTDKKPPFLWHQTSLGLLLFFHGPDPSPRICGKQTWRVWNCSFLAHMEFLYYQGVPLLRTCQLINNWYNYNIITMTFMPATFTVF